MEPVEIFLVRGLNRFLDALEAAGNPLRELLMILLVEWNDALALLYDLEQHGFVPLEEVLELVGDRALDNIFCPGLILEIGGGRDLAIC